MFSLESPQRGDSNEYTQYTISQYKKETHTKLSQICNYGISSKGPKNGFKTVVVNEPSVFEPLSSSTVFCYCSDALSLSSQIYAYKSSIYCVYGKEASWQLILLHGFQGYSSYGANRKLHLKPSRGNNSEGMKARAVIFVRGISS